MLKIKAALLNLYILRGKKMKLQLSCTCHEDIKDALGYSSTCS
jgi:hypothetical protein